MFYIRLSIQIKQITMKKILVTVLAISAFSFATNAQQPTTPVAPPQGAPAAAQPKLSKEQKEEMKKQKEEDLANALTAAGLTDAQKAETKAAIDDLDMKKKELRKAGTLSDELKKSMEKDLKEKLIKVMGEEKFKKFREAQKAAKEAREKLAPQQ